MEDKRISIRFRCDNELDMKAWSRLQELAVGRNTSKNAVIIDCLLKLGASDIAINGGNGGSIEELADMVTDKIMNRIEHLSIMESVHEDSHPTSHGDMGEMEKEPEEDEPVLLSEGSLDFLNAF